MLRARKKHTIHDLRQLKGKRQLSHIHVKSPEEAAAAATAGVDLMSCSYDNAAAQARLPLLVAAAPDSFLSCATPHGMASTGEAIRISFQALEAGASSRHSKTPSAIDLANSNRTSRPACGPPRPLVPAIRTQKTGRGMNHARFILWKNRELLGWGHVNGSRRCRGDWRAAGCDGEKGGSGSEGYFQVFHNRMLVGWLRVLNRAIMARTKET